VYWIATDEGLARFDGVHWTVYNRSNASLPENKITCVTVDKNQIVWFGTYNSGLVKFDGVSFTTYSIFNSELPSNNVTTLLTDYLNVKWVGTRNEGAASFDGIDWKVYNLLKSGLQSDNILSIASDNAGEIWVGSGDGLSIGGLSKIKNGTVTNYSKLNSRLPGQFVSSINLDSKGVVWAATSDGGVAKFDGTTWRVYTMYNSGLKINNLLSVCVDGNDNKWIAGDGLYLYTGQK
jgi:ligand-binding sensor domain-containing protein